MLFDGGKNKYMNNVMLFNGGKNKCMNNVFSLNMLYKPVNLGFVKIYTLNKFPHW